MPGWRDIDQENRRRRAQEVNDPCRRKQLQPVALVQLLQHEQANREIFDGLMAHYSKSLMSERMDVWSNAARSAVELMALDRVPTIKRSDLA